MTHTFGNAGALYQRAMTWWDHETKSIWSQPVGQAMSGEYMGVELFLLPSQVTTWGSWRSEHPETLVMVNDLELQGDFRQGFKTNFVIGLVLDGKSKSYAFEDVVEAGIINDTIGDIPILIWAEEDRFHAFVRLVDGQSLTIDDVDGEIIDRETGSKWDIVRGLATEGSLKGNSLQPVPSSTAYDWAWLNFYPDSEIYVP